MPAGGAIHAAPGAQPWSLPRLPALFGLVLVVDVLDLGEVPVLPAVLVVRQLGLQFGPAVPAGERPDVAPLSTRWTTLAAGTHAVELDGHFTGPRLPALLISGTGGGGMAKQPQPKLPQIGAEVLGSRRMCVIP